MKLLKNKLISLLLVISMMTSYTVIGASGGSVKNNFFKSSVFKKSVVFAIAGAIGIVLVLCREFLFRRPGGNGGGGEGASGRSLSATNLQDACKANDSQYAKEILDHDQDDNLDHWIKYSFGDGEIGENSLYYACKNGDFDLVRLLFDRLENKERNDYLLGISILDGACEGGNDEVFKFLVEAEMNAGINYSNSKVKHPLKVVSEHGKLDLVRWLVQEKNLKDEQNRFGYTALHKASGRGHLEIVKYLVSTGSDLRAETVRHAEHKRRNLNACNKTLPVHLACENGHLEVVKYFVEECGITVDTVDGYGRSLLFYACKSNNPELVEYLAEKDNTLIDKTAFDVMVEKTVIKADPSVFSEKIKEEISETPLSFACKREDKNWKIVEALLSHRDKGGEKKEIIFSGTFTGEDRHIISKRLCSKGAKVKSSQVVSKRYPNGTLPSEEYKKYEFVL